VYNFCPKQLQLTAINLISAWTRQWLCIFGPIKALYKSVIITRHSLVRAKGEVFVLLYVCLFGQRFLSNLRADSRHILHAGVAWVGTCLLPFWGLAAPGGRKKRQMKFSLLWRFLSDISATRARIHTKYYLCTDNVCRRAPSPCGIHRPLGGVGRGS